MFKWPIILLLLLNSQFVFGQACPTTKVLSYRPVQDQDGLGTCASNVASLLMQHNLGLATAPSYIQLSMTHSGAVGERANSFFYRDNRNRERLFNYGAHTCEVINTAVGQGYCDHNTMGFDFVGRTDPLGTQHNLLDSLARYVMNNDASIRSLREQLYNPSTRRAAERNLAAYFQRTSNVCNRTLNEYVATRALERARLQWLGMMRTLPAQRAVLQQLIDRTFNEDGTPRSNALQFYQQSFLQEVSTFSVGGMPSMAYNSTIPEGSFAFIWGRQVGLSTGFIPAGTGNQYTVDREGYQLCQTPELVRAMTYLTSPNQCELPPALTISPEFERQAADLLTALTPYVGGTLDPQAGLVNLISPRCGQQMLERGGTLSPNCQSSPITDSESARAQEANAYQELCQGRAVGVSVCTGFLASTTVVDSNFCRRDAEAVDGHEYHALTLIGFRPGRTEGSRQILIQNSWGRSCPFMQHAGGIPTALIEKVECELEGGIPTGRFWVNSEMLFNNSTGISKYRP